MRATAEHGQRTHENRRGTPHGQPPGQAGLTYTACSPARSLRLWVVIRSAGALARVGTPPFRRVRRSDVEALSLS
jgi:hypothetical protein